VRSGGRNRREDTYEKKAKQRVTVPSDAGTLRSRTKKRRKEKRKERRKVGKKQMKINTITTG
jgi:hypothetical protein